jgi:hypothetical protein
MFRKICVECYYEIAKGVCNTCRNRKHNAVSDDIKQLRISETALKEYFLDKEDLQNISCNRVKSAGNSYYVHLYQQDDVIKVTLNKYCGLEGFLNEKKRREPGGRALPPLPPHALFRELGIGLGIGNWIINFPPMLFLENWELDWELGIG